MRFTNEPIPADQHAATAVHVSRMMPKGKIVVEFDSPAGSSIGKHRRKCKPTINKDGTVTVQAFNGIWQAIPVQVMFEGKPATVAWLSKHIRWTNERPIYA